MGVSKLVQGNAFATQGVRGELIKRQLTHYEKKIYKDSETKIHKGHSQPNYLPNI